QARRAARIVQNLLEFSRPASPQKKLLDVNNLVERTLQLHEHSLRRNNIEVDFRPDTGLPGIIGDANQLIQVFLNLVTNAEQAIREVRESGRLQIRPARSGNRISITFQDDGVGIRPEQLPRIFDPFYTTKRPGGGTGLGLSICMSIIREHGGLIEAEALPAGGSAFTVSLPPAPVEKSSAEKPDVHPAPSESAAPAVSPSNGSAASANVAPNFAPNPAPNSEKIAASMTSRAVAPNAEILKGRSVLVLDDEESLRQLLQEGLSSQGLRVDCAATAEEALALMQGAPRDPRRPAYDILLCDLHLSAGGYFVDGREATARLLAGSGLQKPAVIYMTGDLRDPGQDAPARGDPFFLQKPFRISEVLALFRELLTLAKPQRK
ncbi:MAG TPA: ATP-binding protein, partial [Candidatus Dormibacteraeota bacterium]|nr:ATP-binding protein [Candidatus Dormibacteraeota bacterium]